MRVPVSIGPELLLAAFYLLRGSQVNAAKCNADNCLRAMFPSGSASRLSSASAYCQYASTHMITGTTVFPAFATQACGQDPARYSSACACDPKRSVTPTTTATRNTISSTSTTSSSSMTSSRITSSFTTSTSSTSSTTSSTTTSSSTTSTSSSSSSTSSSTTTSSSSSSTFSSLSISSSSSTTSPSSSTSPTTTTTSTPNTTTTPPSSPTNPPNPCVSETAIVKDSGFECGLLPWTAASVPGTTTQITSPGSSSNFAFEVDQSITPSNNGLEQASVNQDIATVAGKTYTLSFDSYFNSGAAGFIGVKIDQTPVYTVEANDNLGPGLWNANTLAFVASGTTTNVRLEFLFGDQGSMDKVDNVAVVAS